MPIEYRYLRRRLLMGIENSKIHCSLSSSIIQIDVHEKSILILWLASWQFVTWKGVDLYKINSKLHILFVLDKFLTNVGSTYFPQQRISNQLNHHNTNPIIKTNHRYYNTKPPFKGQPAVKKFFCIFFLMFW